MNPITLFLVFVLVALGVGIETRAPGLSGVPFFLAAIIVALSLKMANTWQRFVVLRAGKLQGVKGPGLFFILPIIDNVVAVIDERIQTTALQRRAGADPRHGAGEHRRHHLLARPRRPQPPRWRSPTIARPSTASPRRRCAK